MKAITRAGIGMFLVAGMGLLGVAVADDWMDIVDFKTANVILDDGGYLWVGGTDADENKGLFRFTKFTSTSTRYTTDDGLANNTVRAITKDGNGNYWIGTAGGLTKFDGSSSWQSYTSLMTDLPNNDVRSLAVDASNHIWIGTLGGLTQFDGTSTWTTYNQSGSDLPGNTVLDLEFDEAGDLWIATSNGGVAKLSGTTFTVYNQANGQLPSNYVKAIAFDGNTLWVAMSIFRTGGIPHNPLVRFASSMWTLIDTVGLDTNATQASALSVSNGTVWVGTNAGLATFNGTSWTLKTQTDGLPSDQVQALAVDYGGNLWVGTSDGKLSVYKLGGIVSVVEPVQDRGIAPARRAVVAFHYQREPVTIQSFDATGRNMRGIGRFTGMRVCRINAKGFRVNRKTAVVK